MNKIKKRMFRYFTMVDFEEEEHFLRQQHQQGYRLTKFIPPGFYFFESCKKEDMIYRLDFSDISISEKPAYLQMFRDYGWEYLFSYFGWNYFCRPASSTKENDTIFSDMESKLTLLEKIYHRRLLPIIITIFCTITYQITMLIMLFSRWADSGMGFSWWTFTNTGGGIYIFLIYMTLMSLCTFFLLWVLFHCWRGFRRLKKKYLKT